MGWNKRSFGWSGHNFAKKPENANAAYEKFQVSDGVGGYEQLQVSDGEGGYEDYEVAE